MVIAVVVGFVLPTTTTIVTAALVVAFAIVGAWRARFHWLVEGRVVFVGRDYGVIVVVRRHRSVVAAVAPGIVAAIARVDVMGVIGTTVVRTLVLIGWVATAFGPGMAGWLTIARVLRTWRAIQRLRLRCRGRFARASTVAAVPSVAIRRVASTITSTVAIASIAIAVGGGARRRTTVVASIVLTAAFG